MPTPQQIEQMTQLRDELVRVKAHMEEGIKLVDAALRQFTGISLVFSPSTSPAVRKSGRPRKQGQKAVQLDANPELAELQLKVLARRRTN